MLNKYPIVHPIVFRQNHLIDLMASDKNWTVSNTDKIPINARGYLETGEIYNAKLTEDPFVTLDELDADDNLQAVNRTYRLKARENRIIAIDVEPESSQELKDFALRFPAHLTELSTNGGVHLFIKVPEDLINDDNRYLFDELSVFKEPIPKGESRSAYYEVIFNDHFITFTKRMVTDKPCINYQTDLQAKTMLKDFLQTIVDLDKERKLEREIAKQYSIELRNNIINEETLELIESFLEMKPFNIARENAIAKDPSDFNNDMSRYELSVASTLASHTIRTYNLALGTQSFRDMALKLTEQDLAYAIYMMLEETIPYREKHEEDREGLPWLLYTSKKAYEYIKAQNENDKKIKKS